MMKKLLLSFAVIILFLSYRIVRPETTVVTTPQNISPTVAISRRSDESDDEERIPFDPLPTKVVPAAATPQPAHVATSGRYRDGNYTGSVADAFYGNIQIQARIQNGALTKVQFLQYPNDRQTSVEINSQAMPLLRQEAIQAQSGQVNIISGATDSSNAFVQSLTAALAKAQY